MKHKVKETPIVEFEDINCQKHFSNDLCHRGLNESCHGCQRNNSHHSCKSLGFKFKSSARELLYDISKEPQDILWDHVSFALKSYGFGVGEVLDLLKITDYNPMAWILASQRVLKDLQILQNSWLEHGTFVYDTRRKEVILPHLMITEVDKEHEDAMNVFKADFMEDVSDNCLSDEVWMQ